MCVGWGGAAGQALHAPGPVLHVSVRRRQGATHWCGGGLWGARGSPYPAGHPSSLCPLPEKSQRASILGPTGIATLQPSGNNPEARFPHIQDTAARLLSPDEVTAVLRHCSRVRHCGQSAGRARQGSAGTLGTSCTPRDTTISATCLL